jgi:hypothetical protein
MLLTTPSALFARRVTCHQLFASEYDSPVNQSLRNVGTAPYVLRSALIVVEQAGKHSNNKKLAWEDLSLCSLTHPAWSTIVVGCSQFEINGFDETQLFHKTNSG